MRIIQVLVFFAFIYLPSANADFTADKNFESCLSNKKLTTADMTNCAHDSLNDWDNELNLVYNKLIKHLSPSGKEALKLSQREWIKHRDKEFNFIGQMYNDKRFRGTMYSSISANDRVTIVKSRVLKLTGYLVKFE